MQLTQYLDFETQTKHIHCSFNDDQSLQMVGYICLKKIDEQKVLTHRLLMPNTTVRSGNVSFNDAQIKRTLVKKRKFLLKFVNRAFLFALDRKTI